MTVSTAQWNILYTTFHEIEQKNSALIKGRIHCKINQFSFLKYQVNLIHVLFTALQPSTTDISTFSFLPRSTNHSIHVADKIKTHNKYTV